MTEDDERAYRVTVAIDDGELARGNPRKTSVEAAKTYVRERIDRRVDIVGATHDHRPSFTYGDTVWVVGVELFSPDDAPLDVTPDELIEDVEEIAMRRS